MTTILGEDQRYDVFAHSLAISVYLLIERIGTCVVELIVGDYSSLEQLLLPYAEALAATVEELKVWAEILAILTLLFIAIMVESFQQFLQNSAEFLFRRSAAVLEFVLNFLTRLFYLDEETNATNLGGVQCV